VTPCRLVDTGVSEQPTARCSRTTVVVKVFEAPRRVTRQTRDTEERSRYHCWHRKPKSITYFDCMFVTLVTQHALRMPCIFLCAPCMALTLFVSILTYKRFAVRWLGGWGGELLIKQSVFFTFCASSDLRVIERDIINAGPSGRAV
jgi:hypothetical protein